MILEALSRQILLQSPRQVVGVREVEVLAQIHLLEDVQQPQLLLIHRLCSAGDGGGGVADGDDLGLVAVIDVVSTQERHYRAPRDENHVVCGCEANQAHETEEVAYLFEPAIGLVAVRYHVQQVGDLGSIVLCSIGDDVELPVGGARRV